MQILIVGSFQSGSGTNLFAGDAVTEKIADGEIFHCRNVDLAMKEIVAGLDVDIIVCGTEIDMNALVENLVEHGGALPKLLQSGNRHDSHQFSHDSGQWRNSSAWLGDESEPLRLGQSLMEMEKSLILQTLTHCGGNRTYAADILGISSRTLRSKLQQYAAEGCTVAATRPRHTPHSEIAAMSGKLLS